jgi:hypothetical protein
VRHDAFAGTPLLIRALYPQDALVLFQAEAEASPSDPEASA